MTAATAARAPGRSGSSTRSRARNDIRARYGCDVSWRFPHHYIVTRTSSPTMPAAMAPLSLSGDDARRLALIAQGFAGTPTAAARRAGVPALLRRLGAVQLDTISVLARSHELVAYARLGPVGRPAVEAAYWGGGAF